MKIYFADDLQINPKFESVKEYVKSTEHTALICASDGYEFNWDYINKLKNEIDDKCIVITNCLYLLDPSFGWENGHCEIYLYNIDLGRAVNIQDLTGKELREAHNIEKMYRAGVFGYGENI